MIRGNRWLLGVATAAAMASLVAALLGMGASSPLMATDRPSAPEVAAVWTDLSEAPAPDENAAPAPVPAPAVALVPMEAQLLDLLNTARVERGLRPLELEPRLVDLARERSRDMATRHYFGHVTPEGTMVFDMMDRLRIPYRLAGENLARNTSAPERSPEVAHRGFMNSPKHAENDYDPNFNRVGIGVAVSDNKSIYFTELFAIQDP